MSSVSEEALMLEYYTLLRRGKFDTGSSGSGYRCPFCVDSRKTYQLSRELRRHALDIVEVCRRKDVKERAKHLALERYINRYYGHGDRSESSRKSEARSEAVRKTEPPLESSHKREPNAHDHEDLFVWPTMGVLANIKTELKNGKRVGESGSKMRDDLIRKGFNPLKVIPLWDYRGHSGFAIVEFGKDWTCIKDAIAFEKSFEADNCGKSDYKMDKIRGEKVYGWIARYDDYYLSNIVGEHLSKSGDLKTVSQKQEEEERKNSKLVSKLEHTLEDKSLHCKEIETKLHEHVTTMNKVIAEQEKMISNHNEEKLKMQQREHDSFTRILLGRENLRKQEIELKLREKDLQQREVQNDSKTKKLFEEKKTFERATEEQNKMEEMMIKLAEEQEREKEKLHKKILELDKKLDEKQALELQIERYRGALEVMKHMNGDEDMDVKREMEEIERKLEEQVEELEHIEDLNQALIIKERRSNDELQDARKEMITGLIDSSSARAIVGVKRMGDLDIKPFINASKRKFPKDEFKEKALESCSKWEDNLRDPNWHPFKIVVVNDKTEELVDEEDEKVKELKSEMGEEVYEAVIKALKEMNEYNGSGRYAIPELWNFKENKRAKLKEGIDFILRQWKTLRRLKRN